MQSTTPPYQFSAPAIIRIMPGQSGRFVVSDSGARGLTISVSTPALSVKAQRDPTTIVVWPKAFAIHPGGKQVMTLTCPKGASPGYADISFKAEPLGHGSVSLAGDVVSSVTCGHPALVTTTQLKVGSTSGGLIIKGHAPASYAVQYASAAAGLVLAIVVVMVLVRRFRRRSQTVPNGSVR